MSADLLERDDELEVIERSLEAAHAGTGGVVAIVGPAGIGKSALLQAACVCAEARGLRVLRARGGELEASFPFGLARQLFEPLFARDPGRATTAFAGTAGLAAPLLGVARDHPPPPPRDPRQAALLGLFWLIDNLAAEQPLLLAVDDLHWADRGSAEWLAFSARRLESTPVVIVAALRPGESREAVDALLADAATEVVHLAPLGPGAAASLVTAMLGRPAEPAFAHACAEASGGNPLLLRELARALADQGIAPETGQAERVSTVTSERLRRFVAARLAQLPTDAAALARAVAVLGDDIELRDAAALTDLPLERTAAAGDALREAGVLDRGGQLSFAHPLVRSAVRTAIPPGELAMAHARAARVLDGRGVELVAAQLLHTAPADDAWVVDRLLVAARQAEARGAPGEAVTLLRRAIREGQPGRSSAVLAALGQAEFRIGDWAAVEHLQSALEAPERVEDRAAITATVAQALVASGRFAAAFETLEDQTAIVRRSEPELALQLDGELWAMARIDPAWTNRLLARFQTVGTGLAGETRGERAMLACLAGELAVTSSDHAFAASLAERALAGGRLLAETGGEPPVYSLACNALIWCEAHGLALQHIDAAHEAARLSGSPLATAHACAWRAHAYLEQGAPRRAEGEALAALAIAEQHLEIMPAPLALAWLILAQLEQGHVDAADAAVAGSVLSADVPALVHLTPLLFARGMLHRAHRDHERALADFEAAGQLLERCVMRGPPPVPWRSAAARVLHDLGRDDEARNRVEQEMAAARSFAAPGALGRTLRAAAAVGPRDELVEVLRDAVAILATSGARLEHAHALCDLGAALRRGGARREAREPLREALELATACGAPPLAARARDELRASGARPRRARITGRDALTPAELRVAELATEGLTNREIAQALFVTIKTVETQLGHAYAKLRIGSRRELPTALVAEHTQQSALR